MKLCDPAHYRDYGLTGIDDPAVGGKCKAALVVGPSRLLVLEDQSIAEPAGEAPTGPNTWHTPGACPNAA